jgi:hypothetical protein
MVRTRKQDEPLKVGDRVVWGKHERQIRGLDGDGEKRMAWVRSSTGYYSTVAVAKLRRP